MIQAHKPTSWYIICQVRVLLTTSWSSNSSWILNDVLIHSTVNSVTKTQLILFHSFTSANSSSARCTNNGLHHSIASLAVANCALYMHASSYTHSAASVANQLSEESSNILSPTRTSQLYRWAAARVLHTHLASGIVHSHVPQLWLMTRTNTVLNVLLCSQR